MLKEFIAKILTALAIHPALRGATASQKIGAPAAVAGTSRPFR
jgi:hypothetical protein